MSCRLHAVAGLYPRLSLTATATAGSESNYFDRILASGTGFWELAAETEEQFLSLIHI